MPTLSDDRSLSFEYVEEQGMDHACCVCQRPYYDPVETPCRHTVCKSCAVAALEVSENCPMCRTPVSVMALRGSDAAERYSLDTLRVHCAHKDAGCDFSGPRFRYPEHIRTCSYEVRWREQQPKSRWLPLRMGNTHRFEDDCVVWSVFVHSDCSSDIKKVVFHLHPAFSPCTVEVSKPPFSVRRRSTGVLFNVPVDVHTTAGEIAQLNIPLSGHHRLNEHMCEVKLTAP